MNGAQGDDNAALVTAQENDPASTLMTTRIGSPRLQGAGLGRGVCGDKLDVKRRHPDNDAVRVCINIERGFQID